MNIALIIARIGSKRRKEKNIKYFSGKPVIAYSIINAFNSKLFNRVIVSTESKKIANISKFYGAEIPFKRPKKLANNKTSTIKVIQHAIKKLSLKNKRINLCCIYPVTPLLTEKLLIKSYKKFKKRNADFLIPVLKKEKTNKRFFYINNQGFLRETKTKKKFLYQDAGQFYWGTNKSFMQFNSSFEGNSIPLNISKKNGIDVNTYEDWKQLTKLYNLRNE